MSFARGVVSIFSLCLPFQFFAATSATAWEQRNLSRRLFSQPRRKKGGVRRQFVPSPAFVRLT